MTGIRPDSTRNKMKYAASWAKDLCKSETKRIPHFKQTCMNIYEKLEVLSAEGKVCWSPFQSVALKEHKP